MTPGNQTGNEKRPKVARRNEVSPEPERPKQKH